MRCTFSPVASAFELKIWPHRIQNLMVYLMQSELRQISDSSSEICGGERGKEANTYPRKSVHLGWGGGIPENRSDVT